VHTKKAETTEIPILFATTFLPTSNKLTRIIFIYKHLIYYWCVFFYDDTNHSQYWRRRRRRMKFDLERRHYKMHTHKTMSGKRNTIQIYTMMRAWKFCTRNVKDIHYNYRQESEINANSQGPMKLFRNQNPIINMQKNTKTQQNNNL
jgi:hypothetical protein